MAVLIAAALLFGSLISLRAALRITRSARLRGRLARVASSPDPGSLPVPAWLERAVERAGLAVAADRFAIGWCAAIVGLAGLGLVSGGLAAGLVLASAAAVLPGLGLWLARERAARRVVAALPEGLEAVARSLRSGTSLQQALDEAAIVGPPEVSHELRAVERELRLGVPAAKALERWRQRRGGHEVRLAVTALTLVVDAGGRSARAVDGIAATLRDRQQLASELGAQAAQAKYSAVVLAAAPLVFTLVSVSTDGRSAEFLLRTRLGIVCLLIGLALDGVAAVWMAAITRDQLR